MVRRYNRAVHVLKIVDRSLTARLQHQPVRLKPLMAAMARVGSPSVVVCVGALAACLFLVDAQLSLALGYGLASMALLLNTAIKFSVRRERPVTVYSRSMKYRTYSFPSGHTFGSTVVFGMFAVAALSAGGMNSYFIAGFMVALIGLIGYSRVYVGAHYVSDVVGGWVIGAFVLLLIQLLLGVVS